MSLKYKDKKGITHVFSKNSGLPSQSYDSESGNAISGIAIKEAFPFKLGIDKAGNYGYYKQGSEVLTPFGSQSSTTAKWSRPLDWPNLDVLPRDEQVIYLTIDNTDRKALFGFVLAATVKNVLFEVGNIVNDEFTVIKTYNPTNTTTVTWQPTYEYFSDINIDYPVIKITSPGDITLACVQSPKFLDGTTGSRLYSVVLEAYYCLPKLKGNYYYTGYSTQHVKLINCGNLTTLTQAFQDARGLKLIEFENCDTSKVTSMKQMCWGCTSLTDLDFLVDLDCASCTTLEGTFYGCISLKEIDLSVLRNTGNVTSLNRTFAYSYSLQKVNLKGLDLSNVTDTAGMISSTGYMEELDLSEFDFSNVATPGFLHVNGYKVKRFLPPANFNSNIYLSYINSRKDALDIINNLKPTTGGYTLTIGAANLKLLTEEEKAIATNKGWTLA